MDERIMLLWALLARQSWGRDIDYPSKQPFHTPAPNPSDRLGDWDAVGSVSPDDEELADNVAREVKRLVDTRHPYGPTLIAYYRAAPGLSGLPVRQAARRAGISQAAMYRHLEPARAWVAARIGSATSP